MVVFKLFLRVVIPAGLRDDSKRGRPRRNMQGRPQRGYKVRNQTLPFQALFSYSLSRKTMNTREQFQYLKNVKIEDLLWKEKPACCFMSSCD